MERFLVNTARMAIATICLIFIGFLSAVGLIWLNHLVGYLQTVASEVIVFILITVPLFFFLRRSSRV